MFNRLVIQVKVIVVSWRSRCARFFYIQASVATEYSTRSFFGRATELMLEKEWRSINMRLCGTDPFPDNSLIVLWRFAGSCGNCEPGVGRSDRLAIQVKVIVAPSEVFVDQFVSPFQGLANTRVWTWGGASLYPRLSCRGLSGLGNGREQ